MTSLALLLALRAATSGVHGAIVVDAGADAREPCAIRVELLAALARRSPALDLRQDGVAGSDDLRLELSPIGSAGWRLELARADGTLLLQRTISRAGEDCRDSADLGALMVERYLVELAWPGLGPSTPLREASGSPPAAVAPPAPPPMPPPTPSTPQASAGTWQVSAAAGTRLMRGHRPAATLQAAVHHQLWPLVALAALASLDWPQGSSVQSDSGESVGTVGVTAMSVLVGAALTPAAALRASALVGAQAVQAHLSGSGVSRTRSRVVVRPEVALAIAGLWPVASRWSAFARVSAGYVYLAPTFTVLGVGVPAYSVPAWSGRAVVGIGCELP